MDFSPTLLPVFIHRIRQFQKNRVQIREICFGRLVWRWLADELGCAGSDASDGQFFSIPIKLVEGDEGLIQFVVAAHLENGHLVPSVEDFYPEEMGPELVEEGAPKNEI